MGHKGHNHKEKAVDAECCLLSEENELLKKCLRLLKENSSLEIATILSAIIAFCNGKFRKKFTADFAAVFEEHQQKLEKKAPEPRTEQSVQGTTCICCSSCRQSAKRRNRQMYKATKPSPPQYWEIPQRDVPLSEAEKSTQTSFATKPHWPSFKESIQYDTLGHSAHIRSHLNTKTPMVADLEFDPCYLKSLVLASYYRALANINDEDCMDYSMYYPPFKKLSVGQIMQRLFMFPPRAFFGSRLSRGWKPRPTGRKQSSRKRSVSRHRRRKKHTLIDDDLHVSACLRKVPPSEETSCMKGLKVGQRAGIGELKCVCPCCGNIVQTGESDQKQPSENDSSAVHSGTVMTISERSYDSRNGIEPILGRVIKNVEIINGVSPPPPDMTSLSLSHEHSDATYFRDRQDPASPHDKAPDATETNDDQKTAALQEVSKGTSEEVAAETEGTSTSNNNPQDFSSSSCGRTDSRGTMQGYAPIDPLYTLGKRIRRLADFEVPPPYRSGNPPKLSPILQRDSRSDHWVFRESESSQREESQSPPVHKAIDTRPPYGNGKRHEPVKDTHRGGKDTPREGKDMVRGGKDMSKGEKESLRGGREEKSRELRYFSGSVNEIFEPQAFSSPFVGTLDQQTAFVDPDYDNEGDRNSSSNTPTLDPIFEVPEKDESSESRTCLQSPHAFPASSEPGSSGFIICRTEYLQSGPKSEAVFEQNSSAAVPDVELPDRNYVSVTLPLSSRSRHVEDSQGLKSLLPAVYASVCRSQGDTQFSFYEEKEGSRADSDVASFVCSSRVSSTLQDQTGGHPGSASPMISHTSFELAGRSSDLNLAKTRSVTPPCVVKQAWTASSSSNLTVTSASAIQVFPASLITSGKNILGEIAFQLERRILDYVFANNLPAVELESSGMARKRRFYGYTVNNIGEMINREALAGDYYSKGTERMLRERLRTLLDILTPLGYDLADHARFAQDIINKYGLLSHTPITKPGDPETEVGINGVEVAHLQNAIVCMADTDTERNNLLLILDCLRMLAIEDGRPLFVW